MSNIDVIVRSFIRDHPTLALFTVGVAVMALGLSMVVRPKKHQAALISDDSGRPGSLGYIINEARKTEATTITVQVIGACATVMGGIALYRAYLSW